MIIEFIIVIIILVIGLIAILLQEKGFTNFFTKEEAVKEELEDKIIYKEYCEGKYYIITYGAKHDKRYEVSKEEYHKYKIMDEYIKLNNIKV